MRIGVSGRIREQTFGRFQHSLAAMLNSREAFDSSGVKRSSFQCWLAAGRRARLAPDTRAHAQGRTTRECEALFDEDDPPARTPDQPN